MSRRVVLLASDGPSTRIVHGALARAFGDVPVVLEPRQDRGQLLRRRLRRLGMWQVAGQVAFMALAEPVLRRAARRRIAEVLRAAGLHDRPYGTPVHRVPSANCEDARALLRSLDPAVVVVNGTRVLDGATLAAVPAPFVNLHMGITPQYRGVHGGYWALAEGRPELAGSTVHLLDEGIDTGRILGQATFVTGASDSFAVYPYLHLVAGVPLLVEAARRALAGELQWQDPLSTGPSRLRSHPTLLGYLVARFSRGVR